MLIVLNLDEPFVRLSSNPDKKILYNHMVVITI